MMRHGEKDRLASSGHRGVAGAANDFFVFFTVSAPWSSNVALKNPGKSTGNPGAFPMRIFQALHLFTPVLDGKLDS